MGRAHTRHEHIHTRAPGGALLSLWIVGPADTWAGEKAGAFGADDRCTCTQDRRCFVRGGRGGGRRGREKGIWKNQDTQKQIVRICCGCNGVYNAMPLCGAVTKLTGPSPGDDRCTLCTPAAATTPVGTSYDGRRGVEAAGEDGGASGAGADGTLDRGGRGMLGGGMYAGAPRRQ